MLLSSMFVVNFLFYMARISRGSGFRLARIWRGFCFDFSVTTLLF